MPDRKTILVVDDEVHIRRVLELRFSRAGYDVILAANGQEAIDMIRERHPDAVVTDITMPRMDGRALCEESNALKAEHPFLTLVVTGRISPDEEAWVEQLQDTRLIEKPFSTTKLLEIINGYFAG